MRDFRMTEKLLCVLQVASFSADEQAVPADGAGANQRTHLEIIRDCLRIVPG